MKMSRPSRISMLPATCRTMYTTSIKPVTPMRSLVPIEEEKARKRFGAMKRLGEFYRVAPR